MSRIQRIAAHPAYQQLSAERLRLGLWLSAAMAGIYFVYILTVAFDPQALGTPIASGKAMTWGLVAGVGIILSGFLLTALYVVLANARFDALNERLMEDVR
jgi:uncharacterized membrane protein (DUF485 family)